MNQADRIQQVATLHRRYGAMVHQRCRALLRHPEAAEDAAQEVFVRVLERLDQFRNESSPVTWLYRVTTNICLDRLRRERRNREVELTPVVSNALADGAVPADRLAASREEHRLVFKDVDQKTMQILVHLHFDEMTQAEIAETMGLSRKTIYNKLERLRRRRRKREAR